MKVLHLGLKKKWFYMILEGIKKEEYREIKPYWFVRIVFDFKKVFKYCTGYNWDDDLYRGDGVNHICINKTSMIAFNQFDAICFYHGASASKKYPHFIIQLNKIDVGTCVPEWSDNWQGNAFRLHLGEIIGYHKDPV